MKKKLLLLLSLCVTKDVIMKIPENTVLTAKYKTF